MKCPRCEEELKFGPPHECSQAASVSDSPGFDLLTDKQGKELRILLNAINKVTAQHRHGMLVTKKALDNLANRQLDFENLLGS